MKVSVGGPIKAAHRLLVTIQELFRSLNLFVTTWILGTGSKIVTLIDTIFKTVKSLFIGNCVSG
jgi:hypothetical protein